MEWEENYQPFLKKVRRFLSHSLAVVKCKQSLCQNRKMTWPYTYTQEQKNTIIAKATFLQPLIDKEFMFLTSVRIIQHKRVGG